MRRFVFETAGPDVSRDLMFRKCCDVPINTLRRLLSNHFHFLSSWANNSTELCRVWETISRSAGQERPSFLFSQQRLTLSCYYNNTHYTIALLSAVRIRPMMAYLHHYETQFRGSEKKICKHSRPVGPASSRQRNRVVAVMNDSDQEKPDGWFRLQTATVEIIRLCGIRYYKVLHKHNTTWRQ
jgi:hypothetical protein